MPVTISSIEQKFFLPAETAKIPCHEDLIVRPVICNRGKDNGLLWVATDVICNNHEKCNFPDCRFKTPCEI